MSFESEARRKLVTLETAAAAVHALNAIAIAVAVGVIGKGEAFLRATSFSGQIFCTKYLLAPLLPLFSTLSCIGHLFARARLLRVRGRLVRSNPARWIEYSVSAGLMLWVIATLSGVDNLLVLLMLLAANAALMFCGHVVELGMRRTEVSFVVDQATLVGWVLHMTIWSVIFTSFFYAIREGGGSAAPPMVYAIAPVLFTAHSLFGLVQGLYVWGYVTWESQERLYAVLSLTAKSLLAWMTVGGALRDWESTDAWIACKQ
jgi:hypothetical protein